MSLQAMMPIGFGRRFIQPASLLICASSQNGVRSPGVVDVQTKALAPGQARPPPQSRRAARATSSRSKSREKPKFWKPRSMKCSAPRWPIADVVGPDLRHAGKGLHVVQVHQRDLALGAGAHELAAWCAG